MDVETTTGVSGLLPGTIESRRDPVTGFLPKGVLFRSLTFFFETGVNKISAALVEFLSGAGPQPSDIAAAFERCGGTAFVMSASRLLFVFPGFRPEEAFVAVEKLRKNDAISFSAGVAGLSGRDATCGAPVARTGKLIGRAEEALAGVLADGGGHTGIYTRRRMTLKPAYYTKASLVRLSRLAKRLGRTESSIMREALTDLFDKYDDGDPSEAASTSLLRIRAGFEAFAEELVRGFEGAFAEESAGRPEQTFAQDSGPGNEIAFVGQAASGVRPICAGHSARVGSLAVEVGRAMGIEGPGLRDLALAAAVHDIGKIVTPPGLTGSEGHPIAGDDGHSSAGADEHPMAWVDGHPRAGADLLGRMGFLQAVARAVGAHHERTDGLGFPDGLSGDAIPLAARIIGACDRFDHLVCVSNSRSPFTAAAIEAMKAETGAWDAEVLAALEGIAAPSPTGGKAG